MSSNYTVSSYLDFESPGIRFSRYTQALSLRQGREREYNLIKIEEAAFLMNFVEFYRIFLGN